uniref:Uncharacterized protein n=1 Tax=uncultured marine microorganism HF4000_097M14 TaxID=455520 RepID=B3T1X6_9ZZZZ|nr:hypothetical protein ALOHA_HF4000097M14ctg1g29 [uncultured marine microorganism HF4000_097M14]
MSFIPALPQSWSSSLTNTAFLENWLLCLLFSMSFSGFNGSFIRLLYLQKITYAIFLLILLIN